MAQLEIIDIIKNTIKAVLESNTLVLVVLEFIILALGLIFYNFMNKKVVKNTCIVSSLIVVGFYLTNYVSTLITFINNASIRLLEFIYFPTTLEFIGIMFISFIIMISTLLNRKKGMLIKCINVMIPIIISFLFLNIIEYINVNNIQFDEFSVFTNPVMTSLYELGMGLFVTWLIGLFIYKIDLFIIDNMINESTADSVVVNVKNIDEEEIELPKLKISNI